MQRQRIHRRLRDKIHSEEGFTLSETLMTVVLIGLITMAMAGGIVAAKNVYQRISLRADAQTLLATTVSAVTEDLSSVSSCDALPSSGSSQQEVTLIQSGCPVESNAFFYAESRGYRMQYRSLREWNLRKWSFWERSLRNRSLWRKYRYGGSEGNSGCTEGQ